MADREVLRGPSWVVVLCAVLGVFWLALGLSGGGRLVELGFGVAWLVVAALRFRTRDTVLEADGVTLGGRLVGRRIPWSGITDVTRSKAALRHGATELAVVGRDKPVVLPERRGGRDFDAIRRRWLHERSAAEPESDGSATG